MVTREAPSVEAIRQDILNLIPGFEIKPLFIRPHLKREFIIGLIGARGDGKSGSGGAISLVDFAIRGVPIWSNMNIACEIEIDDITARRYGLKKGGIAKYQSQEIDKWKLLDLDMQYANSFIWLDEINVGYSNVRKTQANTNVDFNIVIQELRKFKSSLGYSVIDEMFIDPQLRSMTDVFIKCEDTALSVEGLAVKKPTGQDIKWTIYPQTGYLVGRENSYPVTHKPLPPVYFNFQAIRGIYDTNLFQRKGKYTMNAREKEKIENAKMQVEESEEVQEQFNQWGWLEEKAIKLKHSGIKHLEASQLWQFLGIAKHGLTPAQIGQYAILENYGIRKHHKNKNGLWVYSIDDFNVEDELSIEDLINRQRMAAAPA